MGTDTTREMHQSGIKAIITIDVVEESVKLIIDGSIEIKSTMTHT